MDNNALFKLSYGLFVVTARQDGKDNGCIVNTAMQITDTPTQIQICINKGNLTHDMVLSTGEFNLSVLSQDAVFWVFQHYGFQSGREVDKFSMIPEARTENGLRYVEGCTNAVLSGKVQPGDAIFIRYEGPRGSGMPEMFYTGEAICSDPKLAASVALITDGRFSGASRELSSDMSVRKRRQEAR